MTTFEFTLNYALADYNENAEIYIDALAKAGCTDAIVGIGQSGQIGLMFSRDAESAYEAITSAITAVALALNKAQLIEASPDLVGLTDVANILGFSRQNMRKLMLAHKHNFPVPVHTGKETIWHLTNIIDWFESRQRPLEPSIKDVARVTRRINVEKEYAKLT